MSVVLAVTALGHSNIFDPNEDNPYCEAQEKRQNRIHNRANFHVDGTNDQM